MSGQSTSSDLPSERLASPRRALVTKSAHDTPMAVFAFEKLGNLPLNLYNIVAYDKSHVMDLGSVRLFYDHANIYLRRVCPQQLQKPMAILKDRFSELPLSARLTGVLFFQFKDSDLQACDSE